MKSNKILVFDISSEFGHYRKFNTTTSPLTYPIPTRTAITGMLGAIIGTDRYSFYEIFSKKTTGIAIQVLNPVKKVNMGFNLLDTKYSFFELKPLGKTRVGYELLKQPRYRIYYSSDNEDVFSDVCTRIKENKHYYSPYLGLSQFTAKIEFVDLINGVLSSIEEYAEILTAINMKQCVKDEPIKFDYERKYSVNVMAMDMQLDIVNERIVTEYSDVIVELMGRPIIAKVNELLKTDFGNIVYL